MLKNFFVNTIRNMRKQSGYVLLNMGGLIIGMTSFLFISLYVIDELSYDRFHSNYENIYRLKVVGRLAGSELDQAVTAAPMAQAMLKISNNQDCKSERPGRVAYRLRRK